MAESSTILSWGRLARWPMDVARDSASLEPDLKNKCQTARHASKVNATSAAATPAGCASDPALQQQRPEYSRAANYVDVNAT